MLSPDGDLAECINLEVRNQEIVPMEKPMKLPFVLEEDEILLLVHNINDGLKNYITLNGSTTVKAFTASGSTKSYYELEQNVGSIKSIQSLGNTVVAYTDTDPHYFLFSGDQYKYLGTKIPSLSLSFNLEGEIIRSEYFDVDVPAHEDNGLIPDLTTDENIMTATNTILAKTNLFIQENSVDAGRFMFPFFVRYALVLYDGTYTHHSAPVLMMPSSYHAPLCGYLVQASQGKPPFVSYLASWFADLAVKVVDSLDIANWEDIVKGVEIFVSEQIYTYDQNGQVKNAAWVTSDPSYKQSSYYIDKRSQEKPTQITSGIEEMTSSWELPMKDLKEVYNTISATSNFYSYAYYSLSDILEKQEFTISSKDVGVNPVSGIQTRKALPDDYMSNDMLVPEHSFVYNKRLNISNIRRFVFEGFPSESIMQNGYSSLGSVFDVYTFIRGSSGKDIVVKSEGTMSSYVYGLYVFFPDTDAYRMVLHDRTNSRYAEFKLSEHSLLNGAFAFSSFEPVTFKDGDPNIETTTDKVDYLRNKLFTSEVNNPFHYPLEGINTVGSDRIFGMAAVTVPISQGQFGQYPLVVFCSDGNFALKVDEQGYYSGISPIQEDTLLGNEKITPLENSILIITKKGMMLTNGGEITPLATQMDGAHFDAASLQGVATSVEEYGNLIGWTSDMDGFLSYLYGARMAYDYSSNRVLIYNGSKSYAYMYYFENGTMSKVTFGGNAVITSVLDYPDTLIQDSSGSLYSLYGKEDVNTITERSYGMMITRPLKMDDPTAMKAIYQIKNLGRYGGDSYVKYLLYASNDGINYVKVNSLRKRSFLYYRFAIYTYMLPKEGFSGTMARLEYRRTHKLR